MNTIFQLLRCLLVLASCYGFWRFTIRRFQLPPEISLFVSLSFIGLTSFLFGIVGLLFYGALIILGLGLILCCVSLIKRESLRPLLTPGVLAFCILAVFLVLRLYGDLFTHVDNYNHWASSVHGLLMYNKFASDELRYTLALNYPLGSSCLIYWFCRCCGVQSEWFQALTQDIYLISSVCTLFVFLPRDSSKLRSLCFAGLVVIIMSMFCSVIDFNELLVDTLLPCAALGCLVLITIPDGSAKKTLPIIIVCAFIPMIKTSGLFYSVAFAFIYAIIDGGGVKKKLGRFLTPLVPALVIKQLWELHLHLAFTDPDSFKFSTSLATLSSNVSGLDGEASLYIIFYFLRSTFLSLSFVALLTAFAVVAVLIYKAHKWGELWKLYTAVVCIWLGYTICLLGMYLVSMPIEESIRLASFDRYYGSGLIFTAGALVMLCVRCPRAVDTKKFMLSLAAVILLCIVFLRPDPEYCLNRRFREPTHYYTVRKEFYDICAENWIPSMDTLFILCNESEHMLPVISWYLFSTENTLVCSQDNLDTLGEEFNTFEFYIVFDETEEQVNFVTEKKGYYQRAGYTYN